MDVLLLDDGAEGGAAALSDAGSSFVVRQSLDWPDGTTAAQQRVDLDAALAAGLVVAGSPEQLRIVLDVPWSWVPVVLRRLSRRNELGSISTALLRPDASFAAWQGLPGSLGELAAVAVAAPAEPVGVVKDDSGGLLLHRARLTPWTGSTGWVRAYLDDHAVADGEVPGIEVERLDRWSMRARTLSSGKLLRLRHPRWQTGRAIQLACEESAISSDGNARDQPRTRRSWWAEPDLWLLAK